MSPCSDCGHHHSTAADRVACAALQGRIRGFPDVPGEGEWACALCGFCATFASVVEHLGAVHRGEQPPTGHLVRAVLTFPRGDLL